MTDFDADLIAARNAMLARELPDMHWANDFNDNIGVPKMDAPERIWAWNTANCDGDWTIAKGQGIEYVRADVAAAQLAEAQAREQAIINAVIPVSYIHNDVIKDAKKRVNEAYGDPGLSSVRKLYLDARLAERKRLEPFLTETTAALERMMAEARNSALDEAIAACHEQVAEARNNGCEPQAMGAMWARKAVLALKTEPNP